jgi:hypothetical protein
VKATKIPAKLCGGIITQPRSPTIQDFTQAADFERRETSRVEDTSGPLID